MWRVFKGVQAYFNTVGTFCWFKIHTIPQFFRWTDVSLTLTKYPNLIEFLEIPQLLNNCVRTNHYDDAFKICNFVTQLCEQNQHVASIFQNMLQEVDKSKDIIINQITKELNGNVQLPTCIKLVGYLRQTNKFSDEELRLTFLLVSWNKDTVFSSLKCPSQARDVWFQNCLNKNTSSVFCKFFCTFNLFWSKVLHYHQHSATYWMVQKCIASTFSTLSLNIEQFSLI